MALTAGTRLGAYEILAPLGEGGMGAVYRARDSRLNRNVALKVLPPAFAADPERVARFRREAQLVASLNHPNIAAIHGLEETDGTAALVLELVLGEDLAQRLRRGPIPTDESISIARQVAAALAEAHDKGIVHRDLKPGNVMVTAEGQVKVLDFGLAKALDPAAAASGAPSTSPTLLNSPTLTAAGTQLGVILGTAGYMSPEQAKGRSADQRSDIWAFGCVLFEMLSGKRAFEGEDTTDTLAAIVRGEPDWQALPAALPPPIRTLLERCLIKDRAQRLADIEVARFLLSEPSFAGAAPLPALAAPNRRAASWLLAAGLATAAVLATLAVVRFLAAPSPPATPGGSPHLGVTLPDGDALASTNMLPLALSPDGTLLAYAGEREGKSQIYLRRLDDPQPKALEGTEGGRSPFFSPDGQWVAFAANRKLSKISIQGAALQTVAEAPDPRGGWWGADGYLYFAPTNISGIWRAPESGGSATEVSHLDRAQGEISHRWPQLLPGNQALLYTIWTGPGNDETAIVKQTLTTGERHILVRGGATARYLQRTGLLLYGRLDGLLAVPWRPSQDSIGNAVPLPLAEYPRLENEGASDYAAADDGTLAYVPGSPTRHLHRLAWVDRAGKVDPLPLPEREYESVAISPDGRQAVVQVREGSTGLWLYDFSRGTLTPLQTGPGSSQAPLWTPDGKRIVYRGTRAGARNIFWKAADGTGEEERLTTKQDVTQTPTSVSPDGRWLVFEDYGTQAQPVAIWLLPLDGDRTLRPLLPNAETNLQIDGRVSPDGTWIAYQSLVSGRFEIYVQPFPVPGPRRQASTEGGVEPLWSRDGRELFYRNGDKLMAVDVRPGTGLAPGAPRVLIEGPSKGAVNGNTAYDISPDGRRFLRIQQAQPERSLNRIDIVLNWFAELKQKGLAN